MVKSDQKRQQKLARKQAKDRKRRQQTIQKRQQLVSLAGQMLSSALGAVLYCGVSRERGMGLVYVCLARRAPSGDAAMFLLLVDTFCLGVKQVLGGLRPMDAVRNMAEEINLEPAEPAVARGLVETAIEFASQAGLTPHADYAKVAPLWGNIERGSIEGKFEMGMDGEHVYMTGPFDDVARQKVVLATMAKHLGTEPKFVTHEPSHDFSRPGYDVDEFEEYFEDSIDAISYQRIDVNDNPQQ